MSISGNSPTSPTQPISPTSPSPSSLSAISRTPTSPTPQSPPPIPPRKLSINEPVNLEETYYRVLGVRQATTDEEVKNAFDTLIGPARAEAETSLANTESRNFDLRRSSLVSCRRVSVLNNAYQALSTAEKRTQYDEKMQRAKQMRVDTRLKMIFGIESTKAFFETKHEAPPKNPQMIFLRMSVNIKELLQTLNLRAIENFDTQMILDYVTGNEAFIQALADKANQCLETDLLSIDTSKSRDGVFASEEQAVEKNNRIILKVRYKNPLTLERDPIQVRDIEWIRDSNSDVPNENRFYEPNLKPDMI